MTDDEVKEYIRTGVRPPSWPAKPRWPMAAPSQGMEPIEHVAPDLAALQRKYEEIQREAERRCKDCGGSGYILAREIDLDGNPRQPQCQPCPCGELEKRGQEMTRPDEMEHGGVE